jgi:hypothetical protein
MLSEWAQGRSSSAVKAPSTKEFFDAFIEYAFGIVRILVNSHQRFFVIPSTLLLLCRRNPLIAEKIRTGKVTRDDIASTKDKLTSFRDTLPKNNKGVTLNRVQLWKGSHSCLAVALCTACSSSFAPLFQPFSPRFNQNSQMTTSDLPSARSAQSETRKRVVCARREPNSKQKQQCCLQRKPPPQLPSSFKLFLCRFTL